MLQNADKCAESHAHKNSDQDYERLCEESRQRTIADKNTRDKAGCQHLPCHTDIEEARPKGNSNRKRRENHRRPGI